MKGRYRPEGLTLCWSCKNTNRHKCSWFNPDNPQPVPGWVAEPRTSDSYYGTPSYHVKECPKFDPEPRRASVHTGTSIPGVQRKSTKYGIRWVANIMHGRKSYHLGAFLTEDAAIAARLTAEEAIARGEEPRRNK